VLEALETLARQATELTPTTAGRQAWSLLRQNLIVNGPYTFLGTVKSVGAQGALEHAIKKYFVMPELLIADYASSRGVVTEVSASAPRLPSGFRRLRPREGGAWIAPLAYQAVLDIAQLAIDNHVKHGIPGTLIIGLRAVDSPQGTELHFVFTDIVSPEPSSSGGYGIEVIKNICRRWSLPEPQAHTTNGVFVLPLKFSRCAYLSWDQERSDEILHN
jgi:hypothetical protein